MTQTRYRDMLRAGLLALLPLADAAAQAGPLVQAGAWQITTEGSGGASVGYQLCFKTGALDDVRMLVPHLAAPANCPPATTRVEGSQMIWQIDCPAQAFKAEARYALGAEAIEASLVQERGAPSVKSTQMIKARRIGACAQ